SLTRRRRCFAGPAHHRRLSCPSPGTTPPAQRGSQASWFASLVSARARSSTLWCRIALCSWPLTTPQRWPSTVRRTPKQSWRAVRPDMDAWSSNISLGPAPLWDALPLSISDRRLAGFLLQAGAGGLGAADIYGILALLDIGDLAVRIDDEGGAI